MESPKVQKVGHWLSKEIKCITIPTVAPELLSEYHCSAWQLELSLFSHLNEKSPVYYTPKKLLPNVNPATSHPETAGFYKNGLYMI